ncbi:MAG: c-type cytochrome [Deltaproteobacteria bacterium]|nr:c-type cytochrome [Deltaproteobacteria bacterium]
MKKLAKLIVASAMVVGFAVPSVMAADGKALYEANGCATCHGPDGKSKMPTYPNLAGQKKKYLETQIMDIMSGKRSNGMAAAMKANPLAAKTDKDAAKAIAKYLSKVN